MENSDGQSFSLSTTSSPWASEVESMKRRKKIKQKNDNEQGGARRMVKGRRRIKNDKNADDDGCLKTKAESPKHLQQVSFENSPVLTERNLSDESPVQIKKIQNKRIKSVTQGFSESRVGDNSLTLRMSGKRVRKSKENLETINLIKTPEKRKSRQSNGIWSFLRKFSDSDNETPGILNDESPDILIDNSLAIVETRVRNKKNACNTGLLTSTPSFAMPPSKILRSSVSEIGIPRSSVSETGRKSKAGTSFRKTPRGNRAVVTLESSADNIQEDKNADDDGWLKTKTPKHLQQVSFKNSPVLIESNLSDNESPIQIKKIQNKRSDSVTQGFSESRVDDNSVALRMSGKRVRKSKKNSESINLSKPLGERKSIKSAIIRSFLKKFSDSDNESPVILNDESPDVLNDNSLAILKTRVIRNKKSARNTGLLTNSSSFQTPPNRILRSSVSENGRKSKAGTSSRKTIIKTPYRNRAFATLESNEEDFVNAHKNEISSVEKKSMSNTFEIEADGQTEGKNSTFEIEADDQTERKNSTFEIEADNKTEGKNSTFETEANNKTEGKNSTFEMKADNKTEGKNSTFEKEAYDTTEEKNSTFEIQTNADKTTDKNSSTAAKKTSKKRNSYEIQLNNVSRVEETSEHPLRKSNRVSVKSPGNEKTKKIKLSKTPLKNTQKRRTFEIDTNADKENPEVGGQINGDDKSENPSKRRRTVEDDRDDSFVYGLSRKSDDVVNAERRSTFELKQPAISTAKRRRRWANFETGLQVASPWKKEVVKVDTTPEKEEIFQKPKPLTPAALEKSQNPKPSSQVKKSASKIPNYALIHQRAFEKMESLDEHVERKKARAHALLSGSKVQIGINKPTPNKTLKSLKQLFPTSTTKLLDNSTDKFISKLKGNISDLKATLCKTPIIKKPLFQGKMNSPGSNREVFTPCKTENIKKPLFQGEMNSPGSYRKVLTPCKTLNIKKPLFQAKINTPGSNRSVFSETVKEVSSDITNSSRMKKKINIVKQSKLKSPKKYGFLYNKTQPDKNDESKIILKRKPLHSQNPPQMKTKLPVKEVRAQAVKAMQTKTRTVKEKRDNPVKERRDYVKGVRSNRRFDLLMSMRNIK